MKTLRDLETFFKENNEEYIEFDNVKNKRSNCPDLHAFILLDEHLELKGDIVSAASHDEFYLSVEPEQLLSLDDEVLLDLIRCGVRLTGYGLAMFT